MDDTSIEPKVQAATGAALITGVLVTLLGRYWTGGVPQAVVDIVGGIVSATLTFAAGWAAKHTDRNTPPPKHADTST
jgi:uncharacterized protein (DUF697 family)